MSFDFTAYTPEEFRARPDYGTVYFSLIEQWQRDVAALAELKSRELAHRQLIAQLTFSNPTEGANNHVFGEGKKAAKLTLTHVINRTLDPAALPGCMDSLRQQVGVEIADAVVEYKPSLKISAYKNLTDAQRAILSPAITANPGSPQLKYTPAKD